MTRFVLTCLLLAPLSASAQSDGWPDSPTVLVEQALEVNGQLSLSLVAYGFSSPQLAVANQAQAADEEAHRQLENWLRTFSQTVLTRFAEANSLAETDPRRAAAIAALRGIDPAAMKPVTVEARRDEHESQAAAVRVRFDLTELIASSAKLANKEFAGLLHPFGTVVLDELAKAPPALPPPWITKTAWTSRAFDGHFLFGVGHISGVAQAALNRASRDSKARAALMPLVKQFVQRLREAYKTAAKGKADVAPEILENANASLLTGAEILTGFQTGSEGYSIARLTPADQLDGLFEEERPSAATRKLAHELIEQVVTAMETK